MFIHNFPSMIIEYSLDENHFLDHQLYTASRSKRIRKNRNRVKYIYSAIVLLFGLYFFYQDKMSLAIAMFVLALISFFVYPLWESRQYLRHYRSFVRENYKERIGRVASMEFTPEYISGTGEAIATKVLSKEVLRVNEIPSSIFVKLKTGESFIIPKNKLSNIEEVKARLKELAGVWEVNYTEQNDWRWR